MPGSHLRLNDIINHLLMSFIMSLCRKCEPGLSGSTTVLIYFLNESNFFELAWTVMNAIVAKLSLN